MICPQSLYGVFVVDFVPGPVEGKLQRAGRAAGVPAQQTHSQDLWGEPWGSGPLKRLTGWGLYITLMGTISLLLLPAA